MTMKRKLYTNVPKTVINNSTNINKTNNHLSLQLIEHKKDRHMMLEIQVHVWDRHKNEVALNQLIVFIKRNAWMGVIFKIQWHHHTKFTSCNHTYFHVLQYIAWAMAVMFTLYYYIQYSGKIYVMHIQVSIYLLNYMHNIQI